MLNYLVILVLVNQSFYLGEGEDGGVVYCEMQGCENTGESKVHREMLRAIYPPGCGYR